MESKRKTAMMELIDICNSDQVSFCEWFLDNYERFIEKEKFQIMDAWYSGFEETRPYVDHSEDYYNETYRQDYRICFECNEKISEYELFCQFCRKQD